MTVASNRQFFYYKSFLLASLNISKFFLIKQVTLEENNLLKKSKVELAN